MVHDIKKVRTQNLLHHTEGPLRIHDIRLVPGLGTREILHGNIALERGQTEPWTEKATLFKRWSIPGGVEERGFCDGRSNGSMTDKISQGLL